MCENKEQTVIVGNGTAAVECFKTMRKYGYSGEIHVFAESDLPVYNPMLISYYVAGKIPYEMMFPYGNDFSVFEENDVIFHQNTPIVKIEANDKIIKCKTGTEYTFDKCLIATGATPISPKFIGSASSKIYTMRTVQDAIRLKKRLKTLPAKVLVLGASMVGIKLVELFVNADIRCVLADMAPHVFPLSASEECARFVEKKINSRGVSFRLSEALESIEDTPQGLRIWFNNSKIPEEVDLLLMCIGVNANTNIIDPNQIMLDRGIIVNEKMETSVENIYAAGDVAQGYNLLSRKQQILGLWANARYQGQTAGANMAGIFKEYKGEIPHNITHFLGMDFVGIGEVRDYDYSEKYVDGQQYSEIFYKEGKVCGANLVNNIEESGILKSEIVKNYCSLQSL